VMARHTKAIILAAGRGSRLKAYTETRPKCLLPFGEKTLLQRQLESFAANGISDIRLVRGYLRETINYSGITYYENSDYLNNNILNSLFYAESALHGDVIVSYSDILFAPDVVAAILSSPHEISIAVDTDWRGAYVGRREHPVSEAELVKFDSQRTVARIGKGCHSADASGEFIGMMRLFGEGVAAFRSALHFAHQKYRDRPFQRAASFRTAYLTDLIQEMADNGMPTHCVTVSGAWREIDTPEDYERALAELRL
jgi:L-glutamine-phosphate cytidylyltransferase